MRAKALNKHPGVRQRWHRVLAGALLVLSAGLAAAPAVAVDEPGETPRRMGLLTPPGQLVQVARGVNLHLFCRGSGPTVVLESGLGGFSLEWLRVQELLDEDFRVCAYDRAGYGWSSPGPAPRTTEVVVAELHTLLEQAAIPRPYILVGHSFGGYTVQAYAKRHPTEVAGLVLVDSSHPAQFERFPAPGGQHSGTRGGRRKLLSLPTLPPGFPAELSGLAYRIMGARKAMRTQRLELMGFETSAGQVARAGALPALPLVVLTRGDRVWPSTPEGEQREQAWRELQMDLAQQSIRGQQVVVPYTGHFLHLDRPDVVAQAVRAVSQDRECAIDAASGLQAAAARSVQGRRLDGRPVISC